MQSTSVTSFVLEDSCNKSLTMALVLKQALHGRLVSDKACVRRCRWGKEPVGRGQGHEKANNKPCGVVVGEILYA